VGVYSQGWGNIYLEAKGWSPGFRVG